MRKAEGKQKIVFVEWIDSCGQEGWISKEKAVVDVAHCQTVGFLVDETKEGIALALSRTLAEECRPYSDMISIPRVAIKKMRILTQVDRS